MIHPHPVYPGFLHHRVVKGHVQELFVVHRDHTFLMHVLAAEFIRETLEHHGTLDEVVKVDGGRGLAVKYA